MNERSDDKPRPLRICYFGTYRQAYGRNQIIINGLRQHADVELTECHQTLWRGIEDRVQQASGGFLNPRFWLRVVSAYWHLWGKHRRTPEYDVMVLGYPGQFDAFLGRLLSWWRRKPMVIDHYMSLYLIAEERGLVAKSPFTGRLIRWLESLGLRLADILISDTSEYIQFHCHTYGLKPDKFVLIPAGADDRIFYPRLDRQPPSDEFRIIYYGTFIPNHGVPTMVDAAARLRDHRGIQFHFYGEGPEKERCRHLAQQLAVDNVHFHGWLDKAALPNAIAQSHLCLGVFGTTRQSLMTIQNKIWECMMMKTPLISGESSTILSQFDHKSHLYLVPRADPPSLADGILELVGDPELCEQMAETAWQRAQQNTISALGARLRHVLEDLLDR